MLQSQYVLPRVMYRAGFFLGVLFLFVPVAHAQSVLWGVSGSLSYHGYSFEEPLPWWDSSDQLFPSVMVHADIPMDFLEGPLGRLLYFSTGLRYTRLASKVDWRFEVASSEQVFTGSFKISEHYLAIPLQFRMHLGRLPVFLLAGPEFGVLMFARKKSETFTPEEFSSSQKESVGNDLMRVNISLYGGVGAVSRNGTIVYLRYGEGLSSAKKDADRTVLDTDWRTREIEFGVQLPIFRAN